jgi:hypothetical protein
MTRRKWFGIGIAALGALCLQLPALSAEDAHQILMSALKARPTFQGEQVSELTGPAGRPRFETGPAGRPRPRRAQRQKVYRDGATLRIDFPDGLTIFDDGREQIRYRSEDNTYQKQPSSFLPQRARRMEMALRRGLTTAELVGEDTVAGRAAWIIDVKETQGKILSHRVWIDKETHVQLRKDEQREAGLLSLRFVTISYTKPSPAQLAFTLPPSAQLAENGLGRPLKRQVAMQMARRWGGLLEPANMPNGYRFRAFYARPVRGQQGLVAVYDGPSGQTISVFQRPSLGSMGMVDGKKERFRVLSAKKGAVDVTVVGPDAMPEADLQKVMGSIPEP